MTPVHNKAGRGRGGQIADLLLWADQPWGHSCGVDPSAPILMDLNVGLPVSSLGIARAVKQVQDLLVIELQDKYTHSVTFRGQRSKGQSPHVWPREARRPHKLMDKEMINNDNVIHNITARLQLKTEWKKRKKRMGLFPASLTWGSDTEGLDKINSGFKTINQTANKDKQCTKCTKEFWKGRD